MPLYTESYLKNLNIRENLTEANKKFENARSRSTFDIFLSHSFLDKELVLGLFLELTNLGYSVYVDWIVDSHLSRENITKASAALIQMRLRSSKSLLLAISHNADLSKWIPWELGFVDGHTGLCALLPVAKSSESEYSFTRREYLLLYPFIKKINNANNQEKIWVAEDGKNYIVFDSWLLNKKPILQNVDITWM